MKRRKHMKKNSNLWAVMMAASYGLLALACAVSR